jgi:RNA polymerase sigma-70 factor (ECF subfamily)
MTAIQFQQQVVNLQENMYNFAKILTANRYDAEDLLQETTLKVLKCQHKYLDNINFKGWVLTIMRNIFINEYRKEVRNQALCERIDDETRLEMSHEATVPTPDDIINVQEITMFIDTLDYKLQEPLILSMSGYEYEEISKYLNIPLGTVKSRIFLARKVMQRKIGDLDYYDVAV